MNKTCVLAFAAILVLPGLACSFAIDLGGPGETLLAPTATTRSTAVPPPPQRPTEAPTSTPGADVRYLSCIGEVEEDLELWQDDAALAMQAGRDAPNVFCVEVRRLSIQRRIGEIRTAHESCPVPSDPHVERARQLYGDALAELVEAADCYITYCAQADLWDVDMLAQGHAHLHEANVYFDQIVLELEQ